MAIQGSRFLPFCLLLSALPCLLQAQATVALTTTSNPSRFGTPLTLTASVTTGSITFPPSNGRVAFYDGATILGSAPVLSGTATLSTLLPAGTRRLRAWFSGDAFSFPASSSVVVQSVQAAPVSNFTLSTVFSGRDLDSPLIADFNSDGIADFAAEGALGSSGVSVYLGNGDGTFRKTADLVAFGLLVTAGDFNLDGKADLVLAVNGTSQLSLARATGHFNPP